MVEKIKYVTIDGKRLAYQMCITTLIHKDKARTILSNAEHATPEDLQVAIIALLGDILITYPDLLQHVDTIVKCAKILVEKELEKNTKKRK